jgi:hypothetical protein
MLNERAQADLVVQGVVDAEQTILLRDGLRAGRGDTIIARRNDRYITDSNGDYIRNGTMLDIEYVGKRDGSLVAIRRDTGATIRLRLDYVEASVELGYATTAHRSQGITVDSGHTVVMQGRLTRELLYVSMTRGRAGNHAYISENDPLDHEALDPFSQPSWQQILGEILAAEGAERTAHEIRDVERSRADSLERLNAEYDYLAQIAAAEDLTEVLKARSPERVGELQQSPSWGALVAVWRRSLCISRPSAERIVIEAFEKGTPATDLASVVHFRLRKSLSEMPSNEPDVTLEADNTARPDLDDLITQVRNRMLNRADEVARAALMLESEWKRNLLTAKGPSVPPEKAADVVRTVATFRDRWGIEDSPLPLGPVPAAYEWDQHLQRSRIQRIIDQAALPSVDSQNWGLWMEPFVSQEASLINVGWQL